MVQLVQPNERGDSVSEVSSADYDRIVDMQGRALKAEHAQGDIIIYDQLTGAARRVGRNVAMQHDLRKVVSYCTGCRQTFILDSHVATHIAQSREAPVIHREAVPVDRGNGKYSCSACDGFDPYGGAARHSVETHIERAKAAGRVHLHAEVRSIQQFGLVPPVVVPQNGSTPVASQEGWKPRRRRRHRSRGTKEVRA